MRMLKMLPLRRYIYICVDGVYVQSTQIPLLAFYSSELRMLWHVYFLNKHTGIGQVNMAKYIGTYNIYNTYIKVNN